MVTFIFVIFGNFLPFKWTFKKLIKLDADHFNNPLEIKASHNSLFTWVRSLTWRDNRNNKNEISDV